MDACTKSEDARVVVFSHISAQAWMPVPRAWCVDARMVVFPHISDLMDLMTLIRVKTNVAPHHTEHS